MKNKQISSPPAGLGTAKFGCSFARRVSIFTTMFVSFGKVVWLFLLTHLNSVIFLGFCPLLHQLILAKGLFWPLFASVWHGPFFGTLDVVQIPQHFSGWWIERMDLSEFEFKVPDHRSLLGEPPRNCWDRWLDLLIGCWSNKELNYYLWKIWKEIKHYTLQFFGWRTV